MAQSLPAASAIAVPSGAKARFYHMKRGTKSLAIDPAGAAIYAASGAVGTRFNAAIESQGRHNPCMSLATSA